MLRCMEKGFNDHDLQKNVRLRQAQTPGLKYTFSGVNSNNERSVPMRDCAL